MDEYPKCASCPSIYNLATFENRMWCPKCLWIEIQNLRTELADTLSGIKAMKEGVGIRIADLETERDQAKQAVLSYQQQFDPKHSRP